MASVIHRAVQNNLLNPPMPSWIPANLHWEVWVGSVAFGASNDNSDMDIYSWAMPRKTILFPHLAGHIAGFGPAPETWDEYEKHHILDPAKQRVYDFKVFSITKFFNLCALCNPNMVDSLFVPRRQVLYATPIGEMVADKRHLFLSQKAWNTYRGYSFDQMSKIKDKVSSSNPKRRALIEKHGYDTKFAMHVVRLLLQVEEILSTGDLTLDRNAKILRLVRDGDWSLEQLERWAEEKRRSLELIFAKTKLPAEPDMDAIKSLLLQCIEHHYGSVTQAIVVDKSIQNLLDDLDNVLGKYRGA
jgi:predicted nucleotidyltransferase